MSRSKADELYKDFHKYGPKKRTRAKSSFRIPTRATFAGPARYVLYRSMKYDPMTYVPPNAPINYIHEHEQGVKVYWCNEPGKDTNVPSQICRSEELTCLGGSLGFGYIDDDDDEVEVECDDKRVELFAVPHRNAAGNKGHALLLIENKSKVIAMIWGGRLRVEPRGIVG